MKEKLCEAIIHSQAKPFLAKLCVWVNPQILTSLTPC